jgi:hypothetical protein
MIISEANSIPVERRLRESAPRRVIDRIPQWASEIPALNMMLSTPVSAGTPR